MSRSLSCVSLPADCVRSLDRRILDEMDRASYWEVAARQANETAALFTMVAIHCDVTIRASEARERFKKQSVTTQCQPCGDSTGNEQPSQ